MRSIFIVFVWSLFYFPSSFAANPGGENDVITASERSTATPAKLQLSQNQSCSQKTVTTAKARAWGETGMTVYFILNGAPIGETVSFSSGSEYGYTVGKGGSACARVHWDEAQYRCQAYANSPDGQWVIMRPLEPHTDNACIGSHHGFGSNVNIYSH